MRRSHYGVNNNGVALLEEVTNRLLNLSPYYITPSYPASFQGKPIGGLSPPSLFFTGGGWADPVRARVQRAPPALITIRSTLRARCASTRD